MKLNLFILIRSKKPRRPIVSSGSGSFLGKRHDRAVSFTRPPRDNGFALSLVNMVRGRVCRVARAVSPTVWPVLLLAAAVECASS